MWPWAHAALGYLIYSGLARARGTRATGTPVLVLALGTQFPDLIDKTFAWYLPLLPTGRTLAHSLLIAVPVVVLVHWWTRRRTRAALGTAFGLGYGSHLVGDALHPVVTGAWGDLTFLLWPVLPSPAYETGQSLTAHLQAIEASPWFLFGLLLTAIAVVVWHRDGAPGLAVLRATGRDFLAAVREGR